MTDESHACEDIQAYQKLEEYIVFHTAKLLFPDIYFVMHTLFETRSKIPRSYVELHIAWKKDARNVKPHSHVPIGTTTHRNSALNSSPGKRRNGCKLYLRPPLPPLDTMSRMSWRACSQPSLVPTISMASSLAWSRGTWILVPVFLRRSLMVLPPEPTTSL
jgi:hypothetical protein